MRSASSDRLISYRAWGAPFSRAPNWEKTRTNRGSAGSGFAAFVGEREREHDNDQRRGKSNLPPTFQLLFSGPSPASISNVLCCGAANSFTHRRHRDRHSASAVRRPRQQHDRRKRVCRRHAHPLDYGGRAYLPVGAYQRHERPQLEPYKRRDLVGDVVDVSRPN